MEIKMTEGGVCAPKGFRASGIHAGIRAGRTKRDLSLLYSEVPANAAGVYTRNLVTGAPNQVTKRHLRNGKAQAAICNSGNANTCNADGIRIAEKTCELLGEALSIDPENIIVASTGVIGEPMSIEPFEKGIPGLVRELSETGNDNAAEGIMTTDTRKKEAAVEFELSGHRCRIGGMAKGSGMIHPDMATMLVFLTTDAAVSSALLQKALSTDIQSTFNMVSVDGDTSTNDMVTVMANGLAGNPEITEENEDYALFMRALNTVTMTLCRMIAGDGEGATKLIECRVTGAADLKTAKICAKSVICSSLVKAAMFGADANWGRVACALGYSGADIDVTKFDIGFESAAGRILICEAGASIPFSEELARRILSESEVDILVDLRMGAASAKSWGCDLTYDYVKINGDYRT